MFCFIFNLKPVYFTKICVSLFICVDLYIFSETIASECCTFHTAPHIYGFLYARGQCRTIDRETVYFYILVGPSEFNEPSTRRFALNSTSSYRFLSNYTHLTCLNFICQHSAITETTVKQRPLAVIWLDTHWEIPGFVVSELGIHAIFSGINTWRVITGYLVCSTFELASCIWPISLLANRPCHGPWTGLGDSGTLWPCRPCIN